MNGSPPFSRTTVSPRARARSACGRFLPAGTRARIFSCRRRCARNAWAPGPAGARWRDGRRERNRRWRAACGPSSVIRSGIARSGADQVDLAHERRRRTASRRDLRSSRRLRPAAALPARVPIAAASLRRARLSCERAACHPAKRRSAQSWMADASHAWRTRRSEPGSLRRAPPAPRVRP